MVELAIALGVTINLVLAEVVGFSAAGLVVPGYLALHLNQPARIAATLLVAMATLAAVRGIGRAVVLYGRRRLAIAVLVGFLLQAFAERALLAAPLQPLDLRVIGYIVPGLVANEALGQGVVPTLAMTLLVAALVRIVLLLVVGWAG